MLSHIDIHYLVGILCFVSNPDDVDITLGDMIFNEATGSARDVDITITYKDSEGKINAFLGFEVKDHGKPLDSIHVEQLCAKLKTHPQITRGNIVSSSGYTEPAKKVANYYGIELFHLKKWENTTGEFGHFIFWEDLDVTELLYQWIQNPTVRIFTSEKITEEDAKYLSDDCLIRDHQNNPILDLETLSKFKEHMAKTSLLMGNSLPEFEEMEINEQKSANLKCIVTDNPMVLVNGTYYQITSAEVNGIFGKKVVNYKPDFKILVNINDDSNRVGCIVTETSMGHLAGLAITGHDRGFQMITIPITDRLKKKIFKQKIS